MRKVLVTGYPGFIARLLVQRLAPRAESIALLVEERFLAAAERHVKYLAGLTGVPLSRFELATGDITAPELGLSPKDAARWRAEVDTVFHLAAVYDLAVPLPLARRVNVDGTERVNDFVRRLRGLASYHYVSTFAVAGRRTGIVREADLEHEAGFHNHYESTKYEAEIRVRDLQAEGLPVAVYRPAVVVGSAVNGRTIKYDGPYMVLKMLRDLPWPLGRLNLGSPDVRFNMVPVDFLVEALATLASQPAAAGRTFHLTDPDPYTTEEIFDLFCEALHGAKCLARVPEIATRLATASGAAELLGVQRQAGPYFFHRCRYDCVNTLDALDGTGVECPRLERYAEVLVRYFRDHPVPEG